MSPTLRSRPALAGVVSQLRPTNLTAEDELMPLRSNPNLSGCARDLLLEPRRFGFTAGLAL